jgi:hypothetical protein
MDIERRSNQSKAVTEAIRLHAIGLHCEVQFSRKLSTMWKPQPVQRKPAARGLTARYASPSQGASGGVNRQNCLPIKMLTSCNHVCPRYS